MLLLRSARPSCGMGKDALACQTLSSQDNSALAPTVASRVHQHLVLGVELLGPVVGLVAAFVAASLVEPQVVLGQRPATNVVDPIITLAIVRPNR